MSTKSRFTTSDYYPGVYFGGVVEFDATCNFDPGTFIAYPTGRKLDDYTLRLGPNSFIRSGSTIYAGSNIGEKLETGHGVVIREQNSIGDHFSIWSNSIIDYGCRIGRNVKIHSNCYIAQFTIIEDDVFLAPGVTIANDPHPGCQFSNQCMRGPVIRRGAQIGVNVTILPFVEIGEGAVIGSGSVVSTSIPPFTVAYGNPAKAVKSIYELSCRTGFTDKPYYLTEAATII